MKFADVAQLVEQLFRKERVGGSIPLIGLLNSTDPQRGAGENFPPRFWGYSDER